MSDSHQWSKKNSIPFPKRLLRFKEACVGRMYEGMLPRNDKGERFGLISPICVRTGPVIAPGIRRYKEASAMTDGD